MNVQNVKQKLDKVNSFYSYLIENQDIVARVDKDAFIASIRALYEACFEEETVAAPVAEPPTQETPQAEESTPPTTKKRPKLVFNHQNASKNTPKEESQKEEPKKEAPQPEETPPVVEQQPLQKEEPQPEETTTPQVSPKTEPVDPLQLVKEQHEALNEEGFQEAYEPLFRYKAATDLSQKLSTSKLDDLQKALGLNEKFLYINELFGGDVGLFQNTIKTLNDGESFEAARHYIEQNLIAQNDWMNKTKRPVAKDFIKLVRRRYV